MQMSRFDFQDVTIPLLQIFYVFCVAIRDPLVADTVFRCLRNVYGYVKSRSKLKPLGNPQARKLPGRPNFGGPRDGIMRQLPQLLCFVSYINYE
jgi:hypothetical protein